MPAKTKVKTPVVTPPPSPAKARKLIPRFAPAPDWVKELFAQMVRGYPDIEPRKMFGYPCVFINGNLACGVFAESVMMRLSQTERTKFLKLPRARLFAPVPGRTMKDYVEVPPEMNLASTELKKWVRKSLAYTKTLPPKVKKPKLQ